MQIDNSTLHHITLPPHFVPSDGADSAPLFSALLPLHGYHQELSITVPSWSLPDFATHVGLLPAELIDMIQAFCSDDDLLSLTSVDKAALATRFCNPRLQKLCFKTINDTEQFLSYCQASQDRQAQALILEEEQKNLKWLTSALPFDPTTRFPLFTQEHLQEVRALTLTLPDQFTAEQYDGLFTYLPGIQHLTIDSTLQSSYALSPLLKAAPPLTLHYLVIFDANGFDEIEDSLPDELWQFTILETLTIHGFQNIYSISEEIGQLSTLKFLTISSLQALKALPASLGQLTKLEVFTLEGLGSITALPKEIGQLNALKSLILERLLLITVLPEDMGQLKALKSFKLINMRNFATLPGKLAQIGVRED
jgi:hypothetical protein